MPDHFIHLDSIGYYVCPPVAEVSPYRIPGRHEVVEILTGGKLRFEVNGEEKIFTRGTVFWHTAGDWTISRTFADDPYRCIVFHFSVRDNVRPGPRVSVWQNPEEAIAFCEECRRAFHSGSADLAALGAYAYSVIRWKASEVRLDPLPGSPQSLQDACAYIERHLGEPLTPDRVARRAGVSRPYLFALFRKYLGKAPLHYIQERRIIRAKIQLTSPDDFSIKEIAMDCGFADLEVFYRQFKKHSGLTPAGYRRKYSVRNSQEEQDV